MKGTIIFAVIALILVVLVGYLVFNYYQSQKIITPIAMPLSNSQINSIPTQPLNLPANLNDNAVTGAGNSNVNSNQTNLDIVPPPPPLIIKMITIANFAFDPKVLTIKAGTKVTWINNDQAPHQIAGDTFNSQTLNTGDSYSYLFNQTGTFNYHCAIHPFMTGQIVVTP